MANADHVAIVKQGAEMIRQWREAHPDERLDLRKADLQSARLHGADLAGADLRGASLAGADLLDAHLAGANLSDADLAGAQLASADLLIAFLFRAHLAGAHLVHADLNRAFLNDANLAGADLREANLSKTSLRNVQKAHQAYFLETVHFTPTDTSNTEYKFRGLLGSYTNDALYFETCQRPWPERWLDWERLRVVGRLPLFGASYTALTFILIVSYILPIYNDQVELMRRWAEQISTWAEQTPALPTHLADLLERLTSLVVRYLHPSPIPQQAFLLVVSTILLAVGATLYTFFCPSRVKEFSRTQWCDQFGRSLLHYWPLAWKHRYIRLVCTACYALGGAGALWVLGTKLWRVLVFILKYSPHPWPWR